MKLVTNDDEQDFVTQRLNELTKGLYKFKIDQGVPKEGLASLPRLEKVPKRINLANK